MLLGRENNLLSNFELINYALFRTNVLINYALFRINLRTLRFLNSQIQKKARSSEFNLCTFMITCFIANLKLLVLNSNRLFHCILSLPPNISEEIRNMLTNL